MAGSDLAVYIDSNNYLYGGIGPGGYGYLILENELQYIHRLSEYDTIYSIFSNKVSSEETTIPQDATLLTEEQYNQIQNGTFQYGISSQQLTPTKIHFRSGTQQQYSGLSTKDQNSLYFITDTGKIYKGSDLMGTKNLALTASNTTNVNTTINGNEISMNLTSDFLDSVNNAGSQWGEIPVPLLPSGNYITDENYYIYGSGSNHSAGWPLLIDRNNNKIFIKVDNNGGIKDIEQIVNELYYCTINNIPSNNINFIYGHRDSDLLSENTITNYCNVSGNRLENLTTEIYQSINYNLGTIYSQNYYEWTPVPATPDPRL